MLNKIEESNEKVEIIEELVNELEVNYSFVKKHKKLFIKYANVTFKLKSYKLIPLQNKELKRQATLILIQAKILMELKELCK